MVTFLLSCLLLASENCRWSETGLSNITVAKMFGVSRKTVWCIGRDECVIRTLNKECLPSGFVFLLAHETGSFPVQRYYVTDVG